MNELKEAFHRDVIRYGHVPTRPEQNKKGTYTGTTYRNRFGSWNKALQELGYPIRKHHGLIEVDCYHCGEIVKKEHNQIKNAKNTFCSQDCLSKATVTEHCDYCGSEYEQSYTNAGKQNGYCSDECRDKSRLALFQCDNCLKLYKADKYSRRQYSSNYCSEQCGYVGQRRTREECIEAFEKGVQKLGKNAPLNKIMKAGGMGGGQYYRHFDSLNDVAREAGYPDMCTHDFVNCETCGAAVKKTRYYLKNNEHNFCDQKCYFEWMRSGALRSPDTIYTIEYGPNWHYQRRAARARDDYTCRSCGMSEEEHKRRTGRRLEVHHIKKARLFDDYKERNHLSNLMTLCRSCHTKWEHMPIRPQLVTD